MQRDLHTDIRMRSYENAGLSEIRRQLDSPKFSGSPWSDSTAAAVDGSVGVSGRRNGGNSHGAIEMVYANVILIVQMIYSSAVVSSAVDGNGRKMKKWDIAVPQSK